MCRYEMLTYLRTVPRQLALDEESVWRAVLSWAKHGANVSRPTAQWSEEDRSRVCAQMSGVINHVKLMLIGEAAASH